MRRFAGSMWGLWALTSVGCGLIPTPTEVVVVLVTNPHAPVNRVRSVEISACGVQGTQPDGGIEARWPYPRKTISFLNERDCRIEVQVVLESGDKISTEVDVRPTLHETRYLNIILDSRCALLPQCPLNQTCVPAPQGSVMCTRARLEDAAFAESDEARFCPRDASTDAVED